jgi:hypothetical protein
MSIDLKVISLRVSMKNGASKEIVKCKFQEYMKCYDQLADPSISQKINHRDIFYDYCRYMMASGDKNKKKNKEDQEIIDAY